MSGNNIDWQNTITGHRANSVNLHLDQLPGMPGVALTNAEPVAVKKKSSTEEAAKLAILKKAMEGNK